MKFQVLSADFTHLGQLPCGGSNAAAFIPDGRKGVGSITVACDAPHNFTYQRADWPRLVFITIGQREVAEPFLFIPSHRSIYGDESA